MAFVEITGADYTNLLVKRLRGDVPELTWLKQFRDILRPHLHPGVTMLDVGCATGYAYNSFKEFGVRFTGLDAEPAYLKIAEGWFSDVAEAHFIEHDIRITAPPVSANIVICSALLEHCPSLMPTLQYLVDGVERILLLRVFLGESEQIYRVPSPVAEYRETHQKYVNQYAFQDLLGYLASRGFKTVVYRDAYTDSMPQFVNGAVRTFFVVSGERPA